PASLTHPRIEWSFDPAILVAIAALCAVYVWRFRAARREAGGRGAGWRQALAFSGAVFALLAALVSPVDRLGENYLFSAHMVQHILIGDIAPPLLLLSLSRVIMRPATRPRIWGQTGIEDQSVGGAVVMGAQSLVLVIAFAILFVRMLLQAEEERRRERLEDAATA